MEEIFRIGRSAKHPTHDGRVIPHDPKSLLVPVELKNVRFDSPAGREHNFQIIRDQALLAWKVHGHGETVYRFTGGTSNCYCIFHQERRGRRRQVNSVEIVDIWGELVPQDWNAFITSVARAFSPDLITFRGASTAARLSLAQPGFHRRRFTVPAVWLIDPSGLLEGRFQYGSLAGE